MGRLYPFRFTNKEFGMDGDVYFTDGYRVYSGQKMSCICSGRVGEPTDMPLAWQKSETGEVNGSWIQQENSGIPGKQRSWNGISR